MVINTFDVEYTSTNPTEMYSTSTADMVISFDFLYPDLARGALFDVVLAGPSSE